MTTATRDLDRLLERICARDKEQITEGRPRWYIRATSPIEWECAKTAASAAFTRCCGCAGCCPYTLVLAAPSRRLRVRCPFSGNPCCRPDQIMPSFARIMAAKTDLAFVQRLKAILKPIGGRR